MQESPAYKYSIKLLSRKNYSTHELKNKLKLKKFELEDIDSAINTIVEKGYINDSEYYSSRAKGLIKRNFSKEFIAKKYKREGHDLPLEHLTSLYEQVDGSNLVLNEITKKILKNRRLLEKKSVEPIKTTLDWATKQKLKNKTLSSLMHKGHSFEELNQLYEKALALINEQET